MVSIDFKFLSDCSTPLEVAENVFNFLGVEFDKECYSRLSFAFDGLNQLGDWCNFQVRYVWFRVTISVSGDSWCYKLYNIDFDVHQLTSSQFK